MKRIKAATANSLHFIPSDLTWNGMDTARKVLGGDMKRRLLTRMGDRGCQTDDSFSNPGDNSQ